MTPLGHEDSFLRPRLDARYRFSKGTLADTRGNGRDAPIPAIRELTLRIAGIRPKAAVSARVLGD